MSLPPPLPKTVYRTGWNRAWADSMDLQSDARQLREFLAWLEETFLEYGIKQCDSRVACSRSAVWFINFHGCDRDAVCNGHKEQWIYEINQVLTEQSYIPCPVCKREFRNLPRLMKWWPI